jgi:hypothetical protein
MEIGERTHGSKIDRQQALVFQCAMCDYRTYRLGKIRPLVRVIARDAWREVAEHR